MPKLDYTKPYTNIQKKGPIPTLDHISRYTAQTIYLVISRIANKK